MLLPARHAAMKLNGGRHFAPVHAAPRFTVAPALPAAYSRIIGTPRVAGDNVELGDCFPTACVNAVQTALGWLGNSAPLADQQAITAYQGMAGYVPGNPATDTGTDPEKGFAWWQQNAIAGYKLQQLIPLAASSESDIRHAIATRGGVLLCLELADEQQNEIIWTATGTPGTWGGHAVWADSYEGELTKITSWGEEYFIRRDYFAGGFVVGAYAVELVAG